MPPAININAITIISTIAQTGNPPIFEGEGLGEEGLRLASSPGKVSITPILLYVFIIK